MRTAGRRGTLTRDDWLAGARKILVAEGIDGVKVDRLAQRMKVTRGSFYYHFVDRKDLFDALVREWEMRNLVEINQVRDRWSDTTPDLVEVAAIWLGEDDTFLAFDLAIRMWARKASRVAKTVHRVDDAWISLLTELFLVSGFPEIESVIRARITYFHQVGYNALNVQEDFAARLKLVPHYFSVLTGREPTAALDELLQRLGRRKSAKRAAR